MWSIECLISNIMLTKDEPNFTGLHYNPNVVESLYVLNSEMPLIRGEFCNTFPNLEKITLNADKIEAIDSESFKNCSKIKKFKLKTQSIEFFEIKDNTFEHFNELKSLEFYNSKIIKIHPNAFHGLGKLEYLDLSYNNFTFIHPDVFKPLKKLQILFLHENKFKDIPVEAIIKFTELKEIYLQENYFDCWRLSNIIEKLDEAKVKYGEGLISSLKCARITLHINLFVSFAANNSLWLIWYTAVLNDTEVLSHNGPFCRLLHIILHYFLLTNYSWMLCEGFYLHTVLVSAFISEKKLVKWLIVTGWAMPAVMINIYAILRHFCGNVEDTIQCWMDESAYTNVLVAPVCISMLLNLLFLCNIVRVVLLKLKAPAGNSGAPPSRTILQAFRATLLLVPLLGLQYMLTPFRPPPGSAYERTYETMSAFTASFQGLCVATLFCFLNGEVLAQIKRRWGNVLFRPRANSYTATQVSPVRLQFVRYSPQKPGEVKV
uniref:CSON015149 protein n=1 Tax=Culicoides sonorensis TaxID=179676 RepID=A0A336MGY9_CULSO